MTTQPTSPASPIPPSGKSNRPRWRILLVLGAVVIIALVTWLVTRDDNDHTTASKAGGVQIGVPTILSEADLRAFGRSQPAPVYWAGPLPNRRYELTQTTSGRSYVRYLTPRAQVGDAAPRFLTVGTYPSPNAYAALQAVGRRKTSVSVTTRSGAIVVYDRDRPTSVYFAFPNQNFQVEVYDPRGERARRSVLDGKVERLR